MLLCVTNQQLIVFLTRFLHRRYWILFTVVRFGCGLSRAMIQRRQHCSNGSQSDTLHEIIEPRIRAKVVKRRVNFQKGYFPASILKAAFQPLKCLVLVAEGGIGESKTISG